MNEEEETWACFFRRMLQFINDQDGNLGKGQGQIGKTKKKKPLLVKTIFLKHHLGALGSSKGTAGKRGQGKQTGLRARLMDRIFDGKEMKEMKG